MAEDQVRSMADAAAIEGEAKAVAKREAGGRAAIEAMKRAEFRDIQQRKQKEINERTAIEVADAIRKFEEQESRDVAAALKMVRTAEEIERARRTSEFMRKSARFCSG